MRGGFNVGGHDRQPRPTNAGARHPRFVDLVTGRWSSYAASREAVLSAQSGVPPRTVRAKSWTSFYLYVSWSWAGSIPQERSGGNSPTSGSPALWRRQPLLRGAVQDPEVSPRLPCRFEDITAAIAFCRSFFPWYNTEHRHAGIAMLTPDGMCWLSADVPCKPPGPFKSRLDQPTRHFHNRRNESVNRNRRCLKVVDRSVACRGQ